MVNTVWFTYYLLIVIFILSFPLEPGVEPNTTSSLSNLSNMVNTVESYILNDKKSKKTKKCHATQPNVNLPPPPAAEQQQPTQEEAVRQLAEKLKIYPLPDSLFP